MTTPQGALGQMQAMLGMQSIGAKAASSTVEIKPGMRVLIVEQRPYREARVVETASRYKDSVDYVLVSYPGKSRWFKPKMEWVYIGSLAVIHEEDKKENK